MAASKTQPFPSGAIDPKVLAAARHNAARLSDDALRKEWRIVSGFPERPPIRVAYLADLRNEFCSRGLPAPVDQRDA